MNHNELQLKLEQLEKTVHYLTNRVVELERRGMSYGPITPVQPTWPSPPPGYEPSFRCHKCGVEWKGAMGYSCPHDGCPVQPKVSCSAEKVRVSGVPYSVERDSFNK